MKERDNMKLLIARLNLFMAANTNVTGDTGMTVEMKTYYSDYLIDNAEPQLIHDQFGQKRPIPANGGKTIEFRKYAPLVKQTTALTEGTPPNGQKLTVTNITATVAQYGGFVALSDVLLLTAIDNNLVEATQLLGAQAGRTLDTITREVLAAGTNVLYVDGKSARSGIAQTSVLTVTDVRKAVRKLKIANTAPINGDFVGIIHPDCAYDLMSDNDWKYPHQYVDTENIYGGELGKIAGVRFVETTEAKIFAGAGASSANVYGTLILGANAYGVTEVTGGGLQHIVKQLGSAGTADPLNQMATVGWKAIKTAVILNQDAMVRVESASSFATTNNNVTN